jgi:hypothetical protein
LPLVTLLEVEELDVDLDFDEPPPHALIATAINTPAIATVAAS